MRIASARQSSTQSIEDLIYRALNHALHSPVLLQGLESCQWRVEQSKLGFVAALTNRSRASLYRFSATSVFST